MKGRANMVKGISESELEDILFQIQEEGHKSSDAISQRVVASLEEKLESKSEEREG
jgi:hypothetical protein